MTTTIEAAARARGMTVDQLRREASDQALEDRTPAERESILARESRRSAGLKSRTLTVREKSGAVASKPKAAKPVTEAEFAATFEKLGLSPSAAKTAARGRGTQPAKASTFVEAGRDLGLTPAGAKAFAYGRGVREVAKDIAGLPATSYAYTPDVEDPSTWRLQISRSADTGDTWRPDEDLVRAAVAKLPGIAGYDSAIDIPAADLPGVKAKLRSAWIACGASLGDMPPELAQEALQRAFRRLGHTSDIGVTAAARGRERRL